MENNEVMMNSSEEIMETAAEELTKTDYCAGLKKVSTVGLAMIAGALTYNQPDDVIDGAFEEVENEKTTE